MLSALKRNRLPVSALVPLIDATYRTLPGPEHTIVMGSSMGGLMSCYAFLERAEAALSELGDAGLRAEDIGEVMYCSDSVWSRSNRLVCW